MTGLKDKDISYHLSSLFEIIQPAMMAVWLSAQNLDVYLHLRNRLNGFKNIGRDKEAEKDGCDGGVACDLVSGEILHYLMNLDFGPQNCSGHVHSGRNQIFPPQNPSPIQVKTICLSL